MSIPSRIALRLRRPRRVRAILARAGERREAFWNWLLDLQCQLQSQFLAARAGRGIGFTRLCFERLEQRSLLTVNWTGLGGNLDWSTAANWDTGAVPTTGDTVMIGSGFAGGTIDDISGLSIQSLNSGSILSLSNPLTVTDSATFSANVTLDDETLTVDNVLTLNAGATLELDNDAGLSFAGIGGHLLDGNGTVTFGGTSESQLYTDGGLSPTPPTTLTIEPNITVETNGQSGAVETFGDGDLIDNEGTIEANGVGNSLSLGTTDNNGTILVNGGSLGLGRLTGGTITGENGAAFIEGTLDGVTLAGSFTATGGTVVENGLTLTNGATLALGFEEQVFFEGAGQQLLGGTGTVTFAGVFAELEANGGGSPTTATTLVIGPNVTVESGAQGGNIEADNAGDQIVNDGTIEASGGEGIGIVNLATNSGTIAAGVGSQVVITGSLVETPSSVTSVDNGGTGSNEFGLITATGAATLDGTLQLNQTNGYVPVSGVVIPAMQFAGHTGNFATVDSTEVAGQPLFVAVTNPDNVTVTANSGTPSPVIAVAGGGQPIADGAATTSGVNDTDFGTAVVGGAPLSETYTISNTGGAPLNLGSVTLGGIDAGDFTVTGQPASSVPPGSSTTMTVEFQPTAAGNRTATISFADDDTTQASPFTFAVSGVATPPVNLAITVVDSAGGSSIVPTTGNALPGQLLSYTIVVSNTGTGAVRSVSVSDPLPVGFADATYTASATGGATGFTASGTGNIEDTVNLPRGSVITYVVSGTVNSIATGALSNTATVTPQAGAVATATDVDNLANLSITNVDNAGGSSITPSFGNAIPGQTLTYTIVVNNSGPGIVTDASVTDPLPADFAGATYTTILDGGATDSNPIGSGDISDTAILPAGSTIIYIVTGTVSGTVTGSMANTATVTPTAGIPKSATDVDTLAPLADLSITEIDSVGGSSITADQGTAIPGGALTYTIVVTNGGPSPVTGATVDDLFPGSISNVTYTGMATGGATGFTISGAGNIDDTAVNLPVGSTITYTAHAMVNASATGKLTNVAGVVAPEDTTDPTPDNNSAADIDELLPTADLSVIQVDNVGGSSITGSEGTAMPGGAIVYTIVVSNNGPSDVTGATVTDPFPADLTGVTYTTTATGGANGLTARGSGNIDDIAVNLPGGSTITYTVHATVVASAAATTNFAVSNVATVMESDLATDPTPGNNSATDIDQVVSVVTAKPDSATTPEDTPVTLDVLANDSSSGSVLVPGSVVITSSPQFGSAVVHADGTITYTPNAGYFGADQLEYTVEDALGVTSDPAEVDLHVSAAESRAPVLSIDNVSHAEGNSGTTPFVFDVRLSAPSSQAVTVSYATLDGTATTADHDFVSLSGTLTFAPGVTDRQITVLVNGDTIYEPDETFSVKLTDSVGAALGTSVGTGTILNDDPPPTLSIDSVSVIKPLAGPANAIFVVTLTGPSEVPLSVHYSTLDDTAVAGIDYSATSGTLNFAASPAGGPARQMVAVQILPTLSRPTNLTFDVVLTSTAGATLTAPRGVGTITEFAQAQPPPVSPLPVPPLSQLAIPLVTLPSTTAAVDVPAARLAAGNQLFALYGSDSSLLLKKDQTRSSHDLLVDLDDLRDAPALPEQHGQDIVLTLALTTVPQSEGNTLSDERPDPQKLLRLAALETALPLPVAPVAQAQAESSRSWWVMGSSALVLAVSSAVLLGPRLRGKGRTANLRRSNPSTARSDAMLDHRER